MKRITDYLRAVRRELKKVSYPTLEEVKNRSVIVVTSCALCGVAFWLISIGIIQILKLSL